MRSGTTSLRLRLEDEVAMAVGGQGTKSLCQKKKGVYTVVCKRGNAVNRLGGVGVYL